jgi:hypothetical protein
VAPAGVEKANEKIKPIKKHIIESMALEIVTDLKLLKTRIDVNAGKIIKLEIIIAPIKRIPTTTVSAVKTASNEL